MTAPVGGSSAQWRRVVALLANEHTARILARLILGEDVRDRLQRYSPSRRAHIENALVGSGVAHRDQTGALTLDADVFRRLLAEDAPTRLVGVERFMRDGRIESYPASPAERGELLRWVAARVLTAGEVVHEREMNERLGRFTADVAALRRYLVDAELVERRRDGTEYALA
ncbi:DUF2087 domain-containing protein [Microbacterium luticocti]|uniref:DUF2087 domain-containing protein n=1 Tax=Microbacterium luticocti TaxID=451764 RepID=UPI0003F51774|nr:DUF2087 domain-containing protein [Microbacterium luticocti]